MTMPTVQQEIQNYERRCGELRIAALRKGGEALLDKVDGKLGVAMRHLERFRTGVVNLTSGVEHEISLALIEAEQVLEAHRDGVLRGPEFVAPAPREHVWQFYMNGSFCTRCGVAIGSNVPCRP